MAGFSIGDNDYNAVSTPATAYDIVGDYQQRLQKENQVVDVKALIASPVLIPAGAIDTIGRTLGLIDEDTMTKTLSSISEGLGETYKDNEASYRLLGDFGASFLGGGIAMKAIQTGSRTMRAVEALGTGGRFTARLIGVDPMRVQRMQRVYGKLQLQAGADGLRKGTELSGRAALLRRGSMLRNLENNVKSGVAAEAFIYAFQQESDFFFPEGMSMRDQLLWSGGGIAGGAFIGHLVQIPAIRRATNRAGIAAERLQEASTGQFGPDVVNAVKIKERVRQGPQSAITAEPSNFGTFQQQATEANIAIREATEGLARTDLIPGISRTDTAATQPIVQQMTDLGASYPRMVAHTESIEPAAVFSSWDKQTKQIRDGHETRIAALKAERAALEDGTASAFDLEEQLADEYRRMRQIDDYMPVLSDRVGNVSVADTRAMSVYSMPAAPLVRTEHRGQLVIFATRTEGAKVGIAANGQLYTGTNRVMRAGRAAGLTVFERTKVYEAMPEALRSARKHLADPEFSIKTRTRLTPDSDAMELDYALALLKEHKGSFEEVSRLMDLSAFKSINEVRAAAYNQKYRLFRQQRLAENKLLKQYKAEVPFFEKGFYTSQDYSNFLNMRMSNDLGDAAPAMEWFESMFMEGITDLRKVKGLDNYDDMMQRFSISFAADMPETTVQGLIRKGGDKAVLQDLLDLDVVGKLSAKSKLDAFTLLVRKPKTGAVGGDLRLWDHQQVARAFEEDRIKTFVSELVHSHNPVLRELGKMFQQEEFKPLIEAIQKGTTKLTQGVNDEPLIRKLGPLGINTVQYQNRHVLGAEQTQMLSDMVQRAAKQEIVKDLKNNTVSLAKLQDPAHRVSAQLYRNYDTAMQQGWRTATDLPDPATGMVALSTAAEDARWNAEIARQMKLSEVPVHLPDPVLRDGTALVMDELSQAGLAEMQRYSALLYEGNHVTSRAMGNSGVTLRRGHNIVPDRAGQEMAFITDEHGRVVDFALGTSPEQARANATRMANARKKEGTELFGVTTSEDVERYYELKRQAFNSATIDVSDAFALTGGRTQEGARRGIITDPNWIKSQLETVHRQMERQANKVTAAYFKPQLEQMRFMQQVTKVNNKGVSGKQAFEDAFDQFSGLLLNTNRQNPGSLYGLLDNFVATPLEVGLEKLYKAAGRLDRPAASTNKMQAVGKELAEKFGYDPVAYGARLASEQLPGTPPPNLKQIIRTTSAMTQNLALRWMEIAHPLLTAASIYTTTPHAIAYLQRGKNETVAAYRLRVGIAADLLDDGSVAVPNATKLVSTTIAKYLQGHYTDVLKEARRLGYTQAPVGEFVEALQHVAGTRVNQTLAKLNRYAGALTDKSEQFARDISMLTAYELYSGVGKQGKHISLAAASDLANKTIADYRGTNRAQIFRGTTGAPLALFQTFGINYFERLFRGIENKNWRSVMTMASSQAFVFGGTSLPGYDALNEQLFSTWNFDHTPEDNIREVFSKPVGDFLLYGTLANLPKLLGAGDGMAISTRGKAQIPFPITPFGIADAPFPSMARRSMQAMSTGFKALTRDPEVGFDQLRESLILAMPNRPTRGILEIMQGYSTNSNGDIIESDTRRLMSVVSRVAGLRTTSEAEQAKILHLDRLQQMAERDRQTSLRRSVVAAMRSDNFSDEDLPAVFESYRANGGSVNGFQRWLKDSAMKAVYSKFDRRALEILRSTERGRETLRFYGAIE